MSNSPSNSEDSLLTKTEPSRRNAHESDIHAPVGEDAHLNRPPSRARGIQLSRARA